MYSVCFLIQGAVLPPGRDSRDSRSSRLVEATEKALGTLLNCFQYMYLVPSIPHICPTFTKSFFKSCEVIIKLGLFKLIFHSLHNIYIILLE